MSLGGGLKVEKQAVSGYEKHIPLFPQKVEKEGK